MPTYNSMTVSTLDDWLSDNYGLPSALYFYHIEVDGEDDTLDVKAILGNCSAIQSIQYVPFISKSDLKVISIPYDVDRFGTVAKISYTPRVNRIESLTIENKSVGSFKCYNPSKTIGGKRSWKNESRLYNYPYQFAMITDHLNSPFEIKYHLCKNNNNSVKVLNTISDRCSYGLYVEGYKGDNGQLESMVSGDGHELPCSSSAYSQWFAQNKNQVKQNMQNLTSMTFLQNAQVRDNMLFGGLSTGLNTVGSMVAGNPVGILGGIFGGMSNAINSNYQIQSNNMNLQNQIKSNMALQKDLQNTPNTIISMGSDVYYGLAKGDFNLDIYKFGLTEEYFNKLGDYFAMFGYKQNKVLDIDLRSRYYYNYIKTIGVNLSAKNKKTIPRNHFEELKSIFNNGVTIWHVDREGVKVGDISMDNKEV